MLLIWREGAISGLRNEPFISPYGPPPNWTNAAWGYSQRARNKAWCSGYWWGTKHRDRHTIPFHDLVYTDPEAYNQFI